MGQNAFSQCHPLVNFLFFLCAIGFGVVIQHPAYILAGILCAGICCTVLCGRKGLYTVACSIPLFLFFAAINPLFNTRGNTVLSHIFGNPYTLEALYHGMAVSGIFMVMLLWFSCYSAVLTSDKFVCLFGSLIPSLSMLLVMVLRMIPSFLRRGQQLTGIRKSIGKGFEGSRREQLQEGMSLLSSLTDWALEGSITTADSMRSRGYGSAKRTTFQIYALTVRDVFLLILMFFLIAFVILTANTEASYTPDLQFAPVNPGLAAYILFLLIPAIIQGKEAFLWHISISKI